MPIQTKQDTRTFTGIIVILKDTVIGDYFISANAGYSGAAPEQRRCRELVVSLLTACGQDVISSFFAHDALGSTTIWTGAVSVPVEMLAKYDVQPVGIPNDQRHVA